MNKIIIYFLLVLSPLFKMGYSQTSFYTSIEDDKFHKPWDILIKSDGNLLFCSYYVKDTESGSTIYELDNYGNIINSWNFRNTGQEFLQGTRMLEVENHIYLFGEGSKNMQGYQQAFISMRKFDMQINEIENHQIKLNDLITFENLIPVRVILKNDKFNIMGLLMNFPWWSPCYFKISKSGQNLYSSYYQDPNGHVVGPEDFYLSSFSENLFTICTDFSATTASSGYFIEFDSTLKEVSKFMLPDGSIWNYTCLQDSDTSFYVAGNSWVYNNGFNWNSTVNKLDMNGNVINQFVFESPEDSASWVAYFNALDTLADGNLIMCSSWNIDNNVGVQQEPTKIMLFKLTPNLDLVWQRYLFGDDGMYNAYSMKAHPDGGIVILGCYSPTPPTSTAITDIFFLKTDSDGLITSINENGKMLSCTEAILYPNPATENVTIEFSRIYTSATLQLMDISGKTVFTTQLTGNRQTIDISALPAGTYLYRISNQKGLEETGKLVVE